MRDARAFQVFWTRFFPEQQMMTRTEALERVGEREYGQTSTLPDYEMVSYHNRVAGVYGAYETADFQFATMAHVLRTTTFPVQHLVSLGCGPASYELWLVSQGQVERATVVDYSPAMIERARDIARHLGIEEQIEFHVCDVLQNPLKPQSADVVFSINAIHWSARWRRWIFEAGRIAKPGGEIFLTCSLWAPRSKITAAALAKQVKKHMSVTATNFVVPPQPIGGMAAFSTRVFVAATRKLSRF